jgi:hypothetical protein
MALIAVTTAGKISVVESVQQITGVAGETIAAGSPVYIDPTTAKFMNALGDTAPHARAIGIGLRSVVANEALTVLRQGVLDGYTLTQAYDAPVYVSDTSGRLGDAAGTVSVVAGRVIPAYSQSLGVAPDKLLDVRL